MDLKSLAGSYFKSKLAFHYFSSLVFYLNLNACLNVCIVLVTAEKKESATDVEITLLFFDVTVKCHHAHGNF